MLKTEIIKSGSIYQSYAHVRHGPFFSVIDKLDM